MKKITKKKIIFLLISSLMLIFCNRPAFIKKDSKDTPVSQYEYIEIHAQLHLPANLNDTLSEFDPATVKITLEDGKTGFIQDWDDDFGFIQDWDDDLGFIQDWDDDLGFIQDWDDDLGFIQDWDDDLGYLKEWKPEAIENLAGLKVSVWEMENNKEKFIGAVPTGPKGMIKFLLKKSENQNRTLGMGLGDSDNIQLFSLITQEKRHLVDLYSDLSYRISIQAMAHPSFKAKFYISDNNNQQMNDFYNELYNSVKTISLDNTANSLNEKRTLLAKYVITNKKDEIFNIIESNSGLSSTETGTVINNVYPGIMVTEEPLPNTTLVPTFEAIDKFEDSFNKWVLLDNDPIVFMMGFDEADYNKYPKHNFYEEPPVESIPKHKVTLSPFKILQYEVTAEMYEKCVVGGGCVYNPGTPPNIGTERTMSYQQLVQDPMNYISFSEAQQFCKWIGGDLPTEAQWEFAARGYDERIFPWGNNGYPEENETQKTYANWNSTQAKDDFKNSAPVLSGAFVKDKSLFEVNGLGGNVGEWCLDNFDPDFYKKPEALLKDPLNLEFGSYHIIRGGDFGSGIRMAFSFRRGLASVWIGRERDTTIGFRCAAPIK